MLSTLMNLAASPRAELTREMDRLFDLFFGHGFSGPTRPYPALNVWEDGERLYAEAEVPGLALDDLEILIQGNELTIKGQRRPAGGAEAVYHRRERGAGQFTRFLTLPAEVDPDRVEARLSNGVLTVVMPKAEQARARKITVRTT